MRRGAPQAGGGGVVRVQSDVAACNADTRGEGVGVDLVVGIVCHQEHRAIGPDARRVCVIRVQGDVAGCNAGTRGEGVGVELGVYTIRHPERRAICPHSGRVRVGAVQCDVLGRGPAEGPRGVPLHRHRVGLGVRAARDLDLEYCLANQEIHLAPCGVGIGVGEQAVRNVQVFQSGASGCRGGHGDPADVVLDRGSVFRSGGGERGTQRDRGAVVVLQHQSAQRRVAGAGGCVLVLLIAFVPLRLRVFRRRLGGGIYLRDGWRGGGGGLTFDRAHAECALGVHGPDAIYVRRLGLQTVILEGGSLRRGDLTESALVRASAQDLVVVHILLVGLAPGQTHGVVV